MILFDSSDGSEPTAGYVCQDPDIDCTSHHPKLPDPPKKYSAHNIREFLSDFSMTLEEFSAEMQKFHKTFDVRNLNNWLGKHHSISGALGVKVEQFMDDYAKTHSRQTSLYDIV